MADFSGTAGTDSYKGTADKDVISGGGGADTLNGGAGDDYIASGERPERFFGDYASDVPSLDTGAERDTLIGGTGNDHFYAGYGDNVDGGTYESFGNYLSLSLLGASAGVTVDFSKPVIEIGGGTIRNIQNLQFVQGSNFADTINANDRSTGYGFYCTVLGVDGDDSITAGYYTRIIDGGDGNDTIEALNGQYLSEVHGGKGNDTITGPRNSMASVYGDEGDDTIYASYYFSSAYGGAGNDRLYLTEIADRGSALYGDDGDDLIDGSLGGLLTADGGAGADTIIGTASNDTLGTGGRRYFGGTPVYGDFGTEHDVVNAGGGDDVIQAGIGDEINGGDGTDTLYLGLGGLSAATGKGVSINASRIIGAGGTVLGGGKLTGIEVFAYLATTDFADTVRVSGTKLPATLATLDGNDVISSDGAAITISGGAGNDLLRSTAGGGVFDGGEGADKADFGKAAARITVRMVDNVDAGMIGGVSQLVNVEDVVGSAFNDRMTGNDAGNMLRGMGGDDQLAGEYGNDTLIGGAGADRLAGGYDDDTYIIEDTLDRITEVAYGGYDTVQAAVTTKLGANLEALVLTGSGAIDGTGNADANGLTGNAGANWLRGLGGNDLLDGGAGKDRIDGGAGDDLYMVRAFGDHAAAEIADSGSGGRDEIRIAATGPGLFTAYAGESGIERIVIGTGTSTETYVGADRSGTAAINVDASALKVGAVIIGNAGANSLTGTGGADLIGGGLGGDTLSGGEGADTLFGEFGSDMLRGGGGADLLYGSEGLDTLTGGLGNDTFAIGTDPFEGVDQITDFVSGSDKLLVINPYLSGILLSGGFRDGTSAKDADDLAIYDKGSGRLYVDYDGNGSQAKVLLVTFTPGTNLAASDILLIDAGSFQQQTLAAQQELLL